MSINGSRLATLTGFEGWAALSCTGMPPSPAAASFRLRDRKHDVVAFAFAEEEVFGEKELGGGDCALGIGFADVVEIDAAAFDVFTGLPFAWGEAGMEEKFHEGKARAFEARMVQLFRRDLADDIAKGVLGDAFEFAAEKDFAGANGILCCLRTVDHFRDGFT